MTWWIGWPPRADQTREDIAIWESEGRILGWVMSDEDDVGEFVSPRVLDTSQAGEFFAAVNVWLRRRGGSLTRYANESDLRAVERLRAAGYEPSAGGLRVYTLSLDEPLPAPGAVHVSALAPDGDVRGRLRITYEAFGVERPFERYVKEYRRFMGSPAYPLGWDLVATTSEGEAAACCVAWPDSVSGIGNFEPVATRPDLQGLGFGRAVVKEGLRRLRKAGMTRALVRAQLDNPPANAFYRALGFREQHIDRGFVESADKVPG